MLASRCISSGRRFVDLKLVNERVERALRMNARAERIIVGIALAIFIVGILSIILAYRHTNPYIASGTALLQGFLYWPIREIRQLRRENVVLQATPLLVATLAPTAMAREIVKLLDFLRRGRS
jgi:hypothetical protein